MGTGWYGQYACIQRGKWYSNNTVSRVWWLGRGRVAYSPEDSNTVCDGPPNNHGHGRIVDVVGI